MSQHVEWSEAFHQQPAYGLLTDDYGTETEHPALLLGSDSTMVVEGTIQELLDFLDQCREAIEAGPVDYR